MKFSLQLPLFLWNVVTHVSVQASSSSTCSLSSSESCSFASITAKRLKPSSFMTIIPGENTRCLNSDSPYRFLVYPGSSSNVLVHFQKDDGCWNPLSVKVSNKCMKSSNMNRGLKNGIFKRKKAENPFRDYTMIVVLYCSGDAHVGNASMNYNLKNGEAVEHRGAVNTQSVFDWINRQPEWTNQTLDNVILSGSSAGSMAAQLYTGMFFTQVFPNYHKASVIMDGYVGVTPKVDDDALYKTVSLEAMIYKKRGTCAHPDLFQWNPKLLDSCRSGELTLKDLMVENLTRFPKITFAGITSKRDTVQKKFYNFGDKSITALSYKELFRRSSEMYAEYSTYGNFVSYFLNGKQHTFLSHASIYRSYAKGYNGKKLYLQGPSLIQWIGKLAMNVEVQSVCDGETKFFSTSGVHNIHIQSLKMKECAAILQHTKISRGNE